MCGIVGLIDRQEPELPSRILKAMQGAMFKRGPDGEGDFMQPTIAMGMRRLSVIDLDHGWQPLTSENDTIIAFQNGEIYNYKTLQETLINEGFTFKTESDTEVLAHGYACWGIEGLLARIDGMYAIAILDRRRRELHLARDRFGEKPLFYCDASGRFAYSSSLTVLAALPWVGATIEPSALDRYLALHFVPGDQTILQGVKRVLPGERLCIPLDDPEPQRFRYYQPQVNKQQRCRDEDLAQQLEYAVTSRLVADVPVGVFLSGGLDSSIVAAIAAQCSPQIDTFSMGFTSEQYDESPYAQAVAQTIGSHHHHFYFDEDSFADLLPQVAMAMDEPVGDQAMLPLYWLCREAKRHVTVALAGEGADEIFAGYGYYRGFASQQTWKQRLKTWLGRVPDQAIPYQSLIGNALPVTPSGFPLLADLAERKKMVPSLGTAPDRWEQTLVALLNDASNPLQRACSADLLTWLPDDLLVKYDRMAMAHSLEGRAPFLEPNLVAMGLALPSHEKLAGDVNKLALRRVAKRWLPPAIALRQKQGFVLPMATWLKQWFERQGGVSTYFSQRELPGLDTEFVIKTVSSDMAQAMARERLIFALVMLVEWYQAFTVQVQDLHQRYQSDVAAS